MMNNVLGIPVSLLIAGTTIGISLLMPKPAEALTFNFSYTFGPYDPNDTPAGSVLSGVVDGDLQPDSNTVTNLRNLSATFRFPSISYVTVFDELFPPRAANSFITLDGSAIDLFGWNSTLGFRPPLGEYLGFGLGFNSSPSSPGSAYVDYVETYVGETFDPSRWTVSPASPGGPSTKVPEPGLLVALALFSTGCLFIGTRARPAKL